MYVRTGEGSRSVSRGGNSMNGHVISFVGRWGRASNGESAVGTKVPGAAHE